MTNTHVHIGAHPVTVPVSREVERALRHWAHRHVDDLAVALEPFGLTPDDIAAPDYRRMVRADEVQRWVR